MDWKEKSMGALNPWEQFFLFSQEGHHATEAEGYFPTDSERDRIKFFSNSNPIPP